MAFSRHARACKGHGFTLSGHDFAQSGHDATTVVQAYVELLLKRGRGIQPHIPVHVYASSI